ncbi:MAG: endonuclease/exonuclease/phosphatase family protein [Bacteroidota bacterium]
MEKPDKKKKRLPLFQRLVFGLNLVAIAVLLLSYTAAWISPETFWPLAFFGLAYPVFFFVNLLFVGYWLMFRKKLMLWSLITILLGGGLIGRHVQMKDQMAEDKIDDYLKVISYNVHSYNRRNWNEENQKNLTSQFVDFFAEQKPDILCLQEHLSYGESERIIREQVRENAGLKYYYLKKYYNTHDNSQCVGIFSRYPIVRYGMEQSDYRGKQRTFFVFADLKLTEDTIRVYSVHLQSIRLNDEYVLFTEEPLPQDKEYQRIVKRNSMKMARKLKHAFEARAIQSGRLQDHVSKSPYPVILCGDFNDTPTSYVYAQINRLLDDTYRKSGHGDSKTYSGKFPSFRIDYIFASEVFESANTQIVPKEWSDHYPVITHLKLREENKQAR